MSVQWGSMNCSTTTLPRRADSGIVLPAWSVRAKPGAGGDGPLAPRAWRPLPPRVRDPAEAARSGGLAADEEHRRIVIERVADVTQHLRAQRVQDLVGVTRLADGAGLGEREELTGPAAGLADPVGVEQNPVTRAELDHGRPARGARGRRPAQPGGELRQAQWQAALGHLEP